MLRMAGWFSGIFFLVLGAYFEITALWVLSTRPRNAAEWLQSAMYSLIPLAYGISVIWRLNLPGQKSGPQTTDHAEVANDAVLAAIIERLQQSKQPPNQEPGPPLDNTGV
jgi:hypothetical protein